MRSGGLFLGNGAGLFLGNGGVFLLGFALGIGGFFLVFSLISWVQQEITLRAAGIAAGMVLILIFAYDVPFDTLLLPPNGGQ